MDREYLNLLIPVDVGEVQPAQSGCTAGGCSLECACSCDGRDAAGTGGNSATAGPLPQPLLAWPPACVTYDPACILPAPAALLPEAQGEEGAVALLQGAHCEALLLCFFIGPTADTAEACIAAAALLCTALLPLLLPCLGRKACAVRRCCRHHGSL